MLQTRKQLGHYESIKYVNVKPIALALLFHIQGPYLYIIFKDLGSNPGAQHL